VSKPYTEKLKDPRWQKKRLEIMQRDDFTCKKCEATTSSLVVHHLHYERGKEPWDALSEALITLCEACHADERERRAEVEQALLDTLRDFLVDDLECFTETLCLGLVTVDSTYMGVERALERVAGWERRSIDASLKGRP